MTEPVRQDPSSPPATTACPRDRCSGVLLRQGQRHYRCSDCGVWFEVEVAVAVAVVQD